MQELQSAMSVLHLIADESELAADLEERYEQLMFESWSIDNHNLVINVPGFDFAEMYFGLASALR